MFVTLCARARKIVPPEPDKSSPDASKLFLLCFGLSPLLFEALRRMERGVPSPCHEGTECAHRYSAIHIFGNRCAVALWLRRCATNRKVAGSIPDGVNGIFH